jgi:hypothetical protein
VVEVDYPQGLEVVIPLEIPTILRPPLLDLQIPAFQLVLLVFLTCKVFWIIHKIFRFVGEVDTSISYYG